MVALRCERESGQPQRRLELQISGRGSAQTRGRTAALGAGTAEPRASLSFQDQGARSSYAERRGHSPSAWDGTGSSPSLGSAAVTSGSVRCTVFSPAVADVRSFCPTHTSAFNFYSRFRARLIVLPAWAHRLNLGNWVKFPS